MKIISNRTKRAFLHIQGVFISLLAVVFICIHWLISKLYDKSNKVDIYLNNLFDKIDVRYSEIEMEIAKEDQ